MSVNAMTSSLISQIETALNMDMAANSVPIAAMISAGVASMAGVGKIPSAPSPIPVIPAGVSAGYNLILLSFSLGPAAREEISARLMALGISVIGINAPPSGLSYLMNQVENAYSLGPAANSSLVAQIIGSAVPTYYNMGSVI